MKTKFTRCLMVAALFFCSNNFINAQVNVQDSLALVDFYNKMNGPNWHWSNNWLKGAPVSEWIGVTVTDNRVTELSFFDDPKLRFATGTLLRAERSDVSPPAETTVADVVGIR